MIKNIPFIIFFKFRLFIHFSGQTCFFQEFASFLPTTAMVWWVIAGGEWLPKSDSSAGAKEEKRKTIPFRGPTNSLITHKWILCIYDHRIRRGEKQRMGGGSEQTGRIGWSDQHSYSEITLIKSPNKTIIPKCTHFWWSFPVGSVHCFIGIRTSPEILLKKLENFNNCYSTSSKIRSKCFWSEEWSVFFQNHNH